MRLVGKLLQVDERMKKMRTRPEAAIGLLGRSEAEVMECKV